MKRIIIGFSCLITAILIVWLQRDLVLNGFVMPFALGVMELINSVSQNIWWILLNLFSLSLFFTSITLPEKKFIGPKREKDSKGRLTYLAGLVYESDRGSVYSGQQLSHILINVDRHNKGLPQLPLQSIERELKEGNLPVPIEAFTALHYKNNKKKKKNNASRLALEHAIQYLKETSGGN